MIGLSEVLWKECKKGASILFIFVSVLYSHAESPKLPFPILFIHGFSSTFDQTWSVDPAQGFITDIKQVEIAVGLEGDTPIWGIRYERQLPLIVWDEAPEYEYYTAEQVDAKVQALYPNIDLSTYDRYIHENESSGSRYVAYSPKKSSLKVVRGYSPKSAAYNLATHFRLPMASQKECSKNGLYFYGSNQVFDPIDSEFGNGYITQKDQTQQLYECISEVLQMHYGDSWKADPAKKVILIGHSQGGLISRNAYRRFSSSLLSNPLNHVEKIITIGTPHIGSPFAESPVPYPLSNYINQVEAFFTDMDGGLHNLINIDLTKVREMLSYNKRFDYKNELYAAINSAAYPTNGYSREKIPIVALYGIATGLGDRLYTGLHLQLNCPEFDYTNWAAGVATIQLILPPEPITWIIANIFNVGRVSVNNGQAACEALSLVDNSLNQVLRTGLNGISVSVYQGQGGNGSSPWEQLGDFVVPTFSQRMDGLYPGCPVIRRQINGKGNPVPHIGFDLPSISSLIPGQAKSTDYIKGETEYWEDIVAAIESKSGKDIVPVINMLLLD